MSCGSVFANQPAMGISILLANKTIPTINSSANIGSIIMDMPAIFNAREDLISSDTDHSSLLRLYEPHWTKPVGDFRHSLFRSRWRSKRRFPISKERTILVAGVETISSLGAFTWIWGEQYKGRKRSYRFLQDLQLSMTKGRLDWWAVNGHRDICSSHFKASNLINI